MTAGTYFRAPVFTQRGPSAGLASDTVTGRHGRRRQPL